MIPLPGSRLPAWLAYAVMFALPLAPVALALTAQSCSPSQAIQGVNAFSTAAQALANLADALDDCETEAEVADVLANAPEVLGNVRTALEAMCGEGGALPPEHKVCRHFAAYEADPAP